MNISTYKDLIANLPVKEQCFTTKRSTWQWANEDKKNEKGNKIDLEEEYEWLKKYNDKWFTKNDTLSNKKEEVHTLTISRQDIFNCNNSDSFKEFILKTIYWGYTGGTRGNHFRDILSEIKTIEDVLLELKRKTNLNEDDFNKAANDFKPITGLGLSTYSKLLYFLDIKFNDYPCLILDQRIIDVFNNNNLFEELKIKSIIKMNKNNKETKSIDYLRYLRLINQLALKLNTKEENIEQFLFTFGNHLKPIKQ